jgi:hypothetical protein
LTLTKDQINIFKGILKQKLPNIKDIDIIIVNEEAVISFDENGHTMKQVKEAFADIDKMTMDYLKKLPVC